MKRVALLLTAAAIAVAGCGEKEDAAPAPATAPAGSPPATKTAGLTAQALLPQLDGLGLQRSTPEKFPSPPNIDIVAAEFTRLTSPPTGARTEIRLYADVPGAQNDFKLQAEGWKNPPPGVFGGDPKNVVATAVTGADEAVGYLASNKDPNGNRIWTDVFRVGRVVVVAHVLTANENDASKIRAAIVGSVAAKAR